MRVLSIDLPWAAADGRFGFAWVDTEIAARSVNTLVLQGAAANALDVFSRLATLHGQFDVVLIDQPVGGASNGGNGYRNVERAFANSSKVTNGDDVIQAPRFQPGARHAAGGLARAQDARVALGTAACVVVESFPQLSIPPLIHFSNEHDRPIGAVTRLKQHKEAGPARLAAAQQLVGAFSSWTEAVVHGPAFDGQPDAVDAMLALLPLLEVVAPSDGPAAAPVWLHAAAPNGAPPPWDVPPAHRAHTRAAWMSPLLSGQVGAAGVRSDGLLALALPGWLPAAGPERLL